MQKLRKSLALLLVLALSGGILAGLLPVFAAAEDDTPPLLPVLSKLELQSGGLTSVTASSNTIEIAGNPTLMLYDTPRKVTSSGNIPTWAVGKIAIPIKGSQLPAAGTFQFKSELTEDQDAHFLRGWDMRGYEGWTPAASMTFAYGASLGTRVASLTFTHPTDTSQKITIRYDVILVPEAASYEGFLEANANGQVLAVTMTGVGFTLSYDPDTRSTQITRGSEAAYIEKHKTVSVTPNLAPGATISSVDDPEFDTLPPAGSPITMRLYETKTFTIHNAKGQTQDYTIEMDMAWRLAASASYSEFTVDQYIYVDGVKKSTNIPAGLPYDVIRKDQTVRVSVIPKTDGKIIKSVKLKRERTDSYIEEESIMVSGNTFSFVMPNDVVTIDSVEFEDVPDDVYNITTSVTQYASGGAYDMGIIEVKNESGGVALSQAVEATRLVATATPNTTVNHYAFEFVEWDATGITLDEEIPVKR